MSSNIITNSTHVPPQKKTFGNEISSPSIALTLMIVSYCVMLYSFSGNFIQPDDGQIINGRNT